MALVPNLLRCFLAKVVGVDLHNFGFILQGESDVALVCQMIRFGKKKTPIYM
jgi:hypothetical protein